MIFFLLHFTAFLLKTYIVVILIPTIYVLSKYKKNSIYEGHPINSWNFFIIQMLIRLAYQIYIVSMAKHVAHKIHYPKFISGQYLSIAKQPKNVSKKPLAR